VYIFTVTKRVLLRAGVRVSMYVSSFVSNKKLLLATVAIALYWKVQFILREGM
jgi:hypothetical protein